MAGIAPGPVKTTAPVPPAAVSASADDAEKLARWRETKEKEWRNTTGNLRKKYATKEQLALYLDRQCAKALEKKKGSARGGGLSTAVADSSSVTMTLADMCAEAIDTLSDPVGSSAYAIKAYIQAKFKAELTADVRKSLTAPLQQRREEGFVCPVKEALATDRFLSAGNNSSMDKNCYMVAPVKKKTTTRSGVPRVDRKGHTSPPGGAPDTSTAQSGYPESGYPEEPLLDMHGADAAALLQPITPKQMKKLQKHTPLVFSFVGAHSSSR